jgi:hypothetical protein
MIATALLVAAFGAFAVVVLNAPPRRPRHVIIATATAVLLVLAAVAFLKS